MLYLLDADDFDLQDEADAVTADDLRSIVTGLPARPGTRR